MIWGPFNSSLGHHHRSSHITNQPINSDEVKKLSEKSIDKYFLFLLNNYLSVKRFQCSLLQKESQPTIIHYLVLLKPPFKKTTTNNIDLSEVGVSKKLIKTNRGLTAPLAVASMTQKLCATSDYFLINFEKLIKENVRKTVQWKIFYTI